MRSRFYYLFLLAIFFSSVRTQAQGLLGPESDTLIAQEAKLIGSDSADDRPTFTLDGKRMYFGSERHSNQPWRVPNPEPGKHWDSDLWYRELLDTTWSAPINIDTPVNNSASQMNPTIHPRGDLVYYISGDGRGPVMQASLINGKFQDIKPVGGQINQIYAQKNSMGMMYMNKISNDIIQEMQRDSNMIDLQRRSLEAYNLHYRDELTRRVIPDPRHLGLYYFVKMFMRCENTITPDGRVVIFSENFGLTDKYGFQGLGDDDLWTAEINENGGWDSVRPLLGVSSEWDETYPYIAADGVTLYFTSNRPCQNCSAGTSGGQDIYISRFENGKFTPPKPLGPPFNSVYDDYGFSIGPDGETAYFVSNRTGKSKLYEVHLRAKDSALKPIPISTVLGRVTDALTGKPVKAQIFIDDLTENENKTSVFSDSLTGNYVLAIQRGHRYGLQAVAQNYLPHSERISFPKTGAFDRSKLDITLAPIEIGSSVEFKNVYFETGKANLLKESKLELDRIFTFLKQYKNTEIEIQGHTDDRGNDDLNQKLSLARAASVRTYLISKGIPASRMTAVGFGKTKPLVQGTDETARAKNRRVEMVIKKKE